MQVNSVSSLSANKKASFGDNNYQRQMLEAFASADDKELRSAAIQITNQQVDSKKHKRASNTLFWTIPLLAGVSAAVSVSGGRVPMLKSFAKTAFSWASSFVAMDLVFAGKHGLRNNSESVKDFERKHPGLSTALTLVGSFAAMFGGGALANKVMSKYGAKVVAGAKKLKIDKFVKNSKVIDTLSKWTAKAPSSLKTFGKGLMGWAPMIAAFSVLGHSVSHERAKNVQLVNNYTQLKDAQSQVRMALAQADGVDSVEE